MHPAYNILLHSYERKTGKAVDREKRKLFSRFVEEFERAAGGIERIAEELSRLEGKVVAITVFMTFFALVLEALFSNDISSEYAGDLVFKILSIDLSDEQIAKNSQDADKRYERLRAQGLSAEEIVQSNLRHIREQFHESGLPDPQRYLDIVEKSGTLPILTEDDFSQEDD